MAQVDKDWIKMQMGKGISAEKSLLEAEKTRRNKLNKPQEVVQAYDRIIQDDERHLNEMQRIGQKYGLSGEAGETGGGIIENLKSAFEGMMTRDPFQTLGNDLMMKGNAINYDIAWTRIFRGIGDEESAMIMERAATEDEMHQKLMRDSLATVGMMETQGEQIEET